LLLGKFKHSRAKTRKRGSKIFIQAPNKGEDYDLKEMSQGGATCKL